MENIREYYHEKDVYFKIKRCPVGKNFEYKKDHHGYFFPLAVFLFWIKSNSTVIIEPWH
jgi:hypothetical protein